MTQDSAAPELPDIPHHRTAAERLAATPEGLVVSDPLTFSAAVAELAVGWQHPDQPDYELLDEIVSGAVGVVPGCEHAAVVAFDDQQQLQAHASSGPETAPMIALQNQLGEGPCRDTASLHLVMRSADVAHDERWPAFAQGAGVLGIGSMLCMPLTIGARTYGSLSLASGVPNAFDEEAELLASIFASHAAIALADADRLENLQTALDTRDLIGQAKGILMGRFGVTADVAFSVLTRESRNSNTKLRAVCENLCNTGTLPSGTDVVTLMDRPARKSRRDA